MVDRDVACNVSTVEKSAQCIAFSQKRHDSAQLLVGDGLRVVAGFLKEGLGPGAEIFVELESHESDFTGRSTKRCRDISAP